jgi:hypothetical protein
MAEVDPDQEAALRRLRAAFGFVEVLRIVDHDQGQDQDDEPIQGEQAPLSTVNRPSISLKGPVTVPQKEQCGPTPHPRFSN